jgi:hypothetical protein
LHGGECHRLVPVDKGRVLRQTLRQAAASSIRSA